MRKLYSEFSKMDVSIGNLIRGEVSCVWGNSMSPKESLSFSLGSCNTGKTVDKKTLNKVCKSP